jgi:protein-L-isoaspartate(D-aspartate) O-methyltransferase
MMLSTWVKGRAVICGLAMLLAGSATTAATPGDGYERARQALIREITEDLRISGRHLGLERLDPRITSALLTVPRHEFVPEAYRDSAYENRPLPIGRGQTISQPFIVAIMTALLQPEPHDRVFELGTGSGYQAAILSPLVERVYTMEIIEPLGESAAERLARLGYDNVEVRVGDGYFGWHEAAPFDGIIVTAAGDHIPPPLVQQLKPGGRMVIPVGSGFLTQQLMLVTKRPDGSLETRELLPVAFVPLTGGH